MNWFDTLFSNKKHPTLVKKSEGVEQNYSQKSYQDIKRGRSIISLARDVFLGQKCHSRTAFRDYAENVFRNFLHHVRHIHRKQWIGIFLLCILGYGIYGFGCIVRTEGHIRYIEQHPAMLVTEEGFKILRDMRRDYQILAPIAGNPLIALEPFSSYGRVLEHIYRLSGSLSEIRSLQESMISGKQWKEVNLFPLLQEVFAWMRKNSSAVFSILDVVEPRFSPVREMGVRVFWEAILRNEQNWFSLIGKEHPTRILLLNQNSDELRAGGGFPGTAFIIEFDKGQLARFQFYDIYALDWHLREYRLPPEGINKLKSKDFPGKPVEFEIRDANYYPRFSESAVKMNELALEAGIGPLDLVVGINQKLLEDLVKLVEPLQLPGVSIPIDHRNVTLVLSMLVEGKKSIQGAPKATVQLLIQTLFKQLQQQGKMQEALFVGVQHVYFGEFVAGSARPEIQSALNSLGIFDRWYGKKGDWFYPLFTSISRNKSDRLMERTFEITHLNACDRSLTLRQKHWFDLVEEARIKNLANTLGLTEKLSMLLPIQGGGDNIQYLRFIVPPGTQLLPKSDPSFHLQSSDSNFSMIDGYETTSPGTTSSITLQYRLPEGYCGEKTEFFKQPGLRDTRFVVIRGGGRVYQKYYE